MGNWKTGHDEPTNLSPSKWFARAEGLEPSAYGFGDRRSTTWATPVVNISNSMEVFYLHKAANSISAEKLSAPKPGHLTLMYLN